MDPPPLMNRPGAVNSRALRSMKGALLRGRHWKLVLLNYKGEKPTARAALRSLRLKATSASRPLCPLKAFFFLSPWLAGVVCGSEWPRVVFRGVCRVPWRLTHKHGDVTAAPGAPETQPQPRQGIGRWWETCPSSGQWASLTTDPEGPLCRGAHRAGGEVEGTEDLFEC